MYVICTDTGLFINYDIESGGYPYTTKLNIGHIFTSYDKASDELFKLETQFKYLSKYSFKICRVILEDV